MTPAISRGRRAAWVCGVLGLIPFWALPPAVAACPARADLWGAIVAAYAALILSFLGGARWGIALQAAGPAPRALAAAMAPTLLAWGLLIAVHGARTTQLLGLALALAVVGVWDTTSPRAPAWYRRLRLVLSAGAAAGLCLGALRLSG